MNTPLSAGKREALAPALIFALCCVLCGSTRADTLLDIYELAVKNDSKLQEAEATYNADLENEKQARARLLPQLNGEGTYSGTRRLQDSKEPVVRNGSVVNSDLRNERSLRESNWNVSLSQTLFDLPTWFIFKSGKEVSEQARATFAYEQQDLIVRTAEAYFNVLREWDNVQASTAEELASKEQLEQSRQRFHSGLVAITDVHEAEAAYDAAVAQRVTDAGKLAAAHEALGVLTGQSHANLWLLRKDFPIAEPLPKERGDWVTFALDNNNSLKAARYGAEAARQNANSKAAEHWPKVTGSLSYQEDHVDGKQVITPDSPFVNPPDSDGHSKVAQVRVSVPLFSSGYTSSQSRQAHEQYNRAIQRRITVERTVLQNTRARHIAVATDIQSILARAQAIRSAGSALEATRAGYKSGTRGIVDVLQTRRALFSSLRDHAKARYDYVMDTLNLKLLAGTLSPRDIYELNDWLIEPDAPTASAYSSVGN